jgi:2-isopropylmalate synthase
VTIVANLELKRARQVLPAGRLQEATRIAHAVSELANVPPYSRQPYVGASAFAHKAGLHASAIRVDPTLYQHEEPESVGNDMRMLVSDMAGRASIEMKGRELGFDLAGDDDVLTRVTNRVKEMEARGYTFEAADASFELLLREEVDGRRPQLFEVESWRVIVDAHGDGTAAAEATVKVRAGGELLLAVGEGNGPVNALDHALRNALVPVYPELAKLELIDYRVRIVDAAHGTDAVTRVLVETSDGETSWETVGVHPNIIEASWEALLDAVIFGLLRHGRT